jgi:hypothetical protein
VDLGPMSNCASLRGLFLSYNQLHSLDLSPLVDTPDLSMTVDDEVVLTARKSLRVQEGLPAWFEGLAERIHWL